MKRLLSSFVLFAFVVVWPLERVTRAQANGKLQIHFMDVWQGDGAILISPNGQTVLFITACGDTAVVRKCRRHCAGQPRQLIPRVPDIARRTVHARAKELRRLSSPSAQ